jgi:hypothetical protein
MNITVTDKRQIQQPCCFTLRKKSLLTIGQGIGWVTEQPKCDTVAKNSSPFQEWNPCHPVPSLVLVVSELSRPPSFLSWWILCIIALFVVYTVYALFVLQYDSCNYVNNVFVVPEEIPPMELLWKRYHLQYVWSNWTNGRSTGHWKMGSRTSS